MDIISTIVVGAILGVIARLIKPGHQSIGWLWTILLGIAGAFVGSFLAELFFGAGRTAGIDWIRWVLMIVMSVVFLGIYLAVTGRSNKTGTTTTMR